MGKRDLYKRTVYGVGYLGESDYKVSENGKCTKQYKVWCEMIRRCYSDASHKAKPSYKKYSVDPAWHCFSTFAEWYDKNYYCIDNEKMQLDKDILIKGNKLYSPETCVFVPQIINLLFIKNDADRGDLPIGVYWNKRDKNFRARCRNRGKRINIGEYSTKEEAFKAYKAYKENLIKEIANEYKSQIPMSLYQAMVEYEVEITD
jgi:hypothetical protein